MIGAISAQGQAAICADPENSPKYQTPPDYLSFCSFRSGFSHSIDTLASD